MSVLAPLELRGGNPASRVTARLGELLTRPRWTDRMGDATAFELLALIRRGTSEPAAVWRHAAKNLGVATAERVTSRGRGSIAFGSKPFCTDQSRPERRSARSINVCEPMDEPWSLPAEVIAAPDGRADIYVISADGGLPRRLTTEGSGELIPSWSRDGKWIYFPSNRTGIFQVWKAPCQP